jgi:spore germination cell wall hydrolase CwlJ-like protein
MKTKRTLISTIVFLSVFCLSIVFDIKTTFYFTKASRSKTENVLMEKTNTIPGVIEEVSIVPFSYNTTIANTLDSIPYNTAIGTGTDSAVISDEVTKDSEKVGQNSDGPEENETNNNGLTTEKAVALETITEETTDKSDTNSEETKEKETNKKSQYANIGISIAASYVNIREKASTDSAILGKLYKNSAAEIIQTKEDWYYVESGSVKGYVKCEFIKTGIPDQELIEKFGTLSIAVKADGLNVREKPDTEADKLTVIYSNEKYPVVDLQDEWIKVDITDDRVIGYVKREYVELIADFKKAVSKEEEKELLRIQEEERIKNETKVKYRDEVNYTAEELKLLACLVHSEAGTQTYEGKLAVANIVLNRVKSRKYPNSIKAVIYQPGQFTVASSGSLAKQLANYRNYSSNSQLLSIKAAKEALQGANNIGTRLYFHSYKAAVQKGYDSKTGCVRLDDQLFW